MAKTDGNTSPNRRQMDFNKLKAEKKELEDEILKLKKLAFEDSLTGLQNRRSFDLFLQKLPVNFPEGNSIVFLDIDFFKKINDTYGHDVGDLVLKHISAVLKIHIREQDHLARIGGEELAIVMPKTSIDDAGVLVKRIRDCIAESFSENETTLPKVTASFGLSHLGKGDTVKDALKRADEALYEAKNSGRDRVVEERRDRRTFR